VSDETSGTSAGNDAGESAEALADGEKEYQPPAPDSLEAKRLDTVSVELTWTGTLPVETLHKFQLFRAVNDEPWEVLTTTTNREFTDNDAEIVRDYRYAVSIVQLGTGKAGPPAGDVRVNWAPATLAAGAVEYGEPMPPWPDGEMTVSEFLPNLSGWFAGPQEFTLPGEFESIEEPSPGIVRLIGLQAGWMPRGKALSASGTVKSKNY
jgi:hypothetical protein